MDMLLSVMFGIIIGIGVEMFANDIKQDSMCKGNPEIVETEDTVRTFICIVELKKGN